MGYKRADLPSGGGDFLKARDLPPTWKEDFTIDAVDIQTFPARDDQPEQQKLILSFRETEKTLPLNKTNMDILFENVDEDTDNWIGAVIRLAIGPTKFGPGIKVQVFAQQASPTPAGLETEAPGTPAASPAMTDEDFDDDIPF